MLDFKNLNTILKMGEEILSDMVTEFSKTVSKMEKPLLANISKTEKNFTVEILLPGIKKENISIDVEKDILSVEVNSDSDEEIKKDFVQIRWFTFDKGSFKLRLPENGYQADEITSELKNGILTISIPTKDIAPTKKIIIN